MSKEINIQILGGTHFDLTNFDFSCKGITIFDIQSQEFENYIEELEPHYKNHNLLFVNELREKIFSEYDKKYAIVKNNPLSDFKGEDLTTVWKILLIIFPSDLQLDCIIHYDNSEGLFQASHMSLYEKNMTGDYPGDLLFSLDEYIPEINTFISKYFDRFKLLNYIGITIENYITSFSASHYHYQYLTLCIALESIIFGNQELTYRLRRCVTVLCGADKFNCDIIYQNLNKIYALRSKIIHGEKYDIKKVIEYLKPLKAIVSRTIIELIVHNIPTNKKLNEIINRLGFGERKSISPKWEDYKLNIKTQVASNWEKIE